MESWTSLGRSPTSPVGGNVQTVRVDVETAAERVADLVSSRPGRPLIVAVDGASAAGTSTLAAAVGLRLGASVMDGDDFYRDLPEQRRAALTPAEGVDQYFDWQRLRHEILQPLRAGRRPIPAVRLACRSRPGPADHRGPSDTGHRR